MKKKAVFIVAHEMFRDEEYAEPKKILVDGGVEVVTASSKTGAITGKLGMQAEADITLADVDVSEYDVVIFIGGPGCKEYYENKTAHELCTSAVLQDKLLAAICSAPVILAHAGVIKGKTMTCFEGDTAECKKFGGNVTGRSVEIDGKLITGSGPKAADEFGKAVLKALK